MSEWSIEHAWKTNPASRVEQHRNISSHNRFNDFPPQNDSRCEPVNVGICRRFGDDLTQFLHSSHPHLPRCFSVFVSTSSSRDDLKSQPTPLGQMLCSRRGPRVVQLPAFEWMTNSPSTRLDSRHARQTEIPRSAGTDSGSNPRPPSRTVKVRTLGVPSSLTATWAEARDGRHSERYLQHSEQARARCCGRPFRTRADP